jgi:hypothetical protein
MKKAIFFSFMLVLTLGLFSCNGKESNDAGNEKKETTKEATDETTSQGGLRKDLEYVDLGLPSGTLWSMTNAGGDDAFYTYDEAIQKFGRQLPTIYQLQELMELCTWSRVSRGCKIFGPNGNFIFLPALGTIDCDGVHHSFTDSKDPLGAYMSSTIDNDDDEVFFLGFNPYEVNADGIWVEDIDLCVSLPVRLVK